MALATGLGVATISSSLVGYAQDDGVEVKLRVPTAKPGSVPKPTEMAQAVTGDADADADDKSADDEADESATETDETTSEAKETDASPSETAEKEDTSMSNDSSEARSPEDEKAFRQTMHEGDVALGVCGARVSSLLWFYEASVAQGREELKPAVASLTESREAIKAEAERRAVDDKVDTSVRVMNSESEKLWDELNKKAEGDPEEFQKAHDELFAGVQECLGLFFDRPDS